MMLSSDRMALLLQLKCCAHRDVSGISKGVREKDLGEGKLTKGNGI